ncbi:hypothetical protein [Vibrio gazogenes]|uniref:Uncharacterized protein n=2 Tax=Vibrio gazogenes TaxID=687 RepID=A0A1M4U3L9_VIBGA|nr:hypothetical protein [Vibrio gazogenes]ASA57633.1 hypothetical protein BSQ33_17950 [Vibrio gazogenes]USP16232.1 hypothetical protein MKS89_17780 [Vibrio gazogenes]SHE51329.1 hypothetical protein SAMN02745781_00464 [Vibrio gazogenes DSM 21264] [Vibrio gazogenes DSM 21264 = NBRC 103151]SJN53161.1 hypothetical protein BQ6471_00290 [Vibrio gazogenes]
MKQDKSSHTLVDADQSVRDFIASLYETFSAQLKQQDDPRVKIEYFGAVIEVRLLSFDGVYESDAKEVACR